MGMEKLRHLRQQIETTESQLRDLKSQLQQAELEVEATRQTEQAYRENLTAGWSDETSSGFQPIDRDGVPSKVLLDSIVTNGEARKSTGSSWSTLR